MTVREPLPAPDRSRRPGPKGKVGQRPDRLPGPRDAAPARAAALSGEVGRRRQPQPGKMFNVESAERVELCESLLTWVWMTGGAGKTPARPPPRPSDRLSGIPPVLVAGGECPGRRCRHIRGLGRAEPGPGWCGRVCTRGRAGVGGEVPAGRRSFSPGSGGDFPGGRCWPGGG